jgi:hypothetical protein
MDTANLEAIAEQQDASKEVVAAETIGALVDQYEDHQLATGRHQEPKKQTLGGGGGGGGGGGSWKKLATVPRMVDPPCHSSKV